MTMAKMNIKGIQRTQKRNLKRIARLSKMGDMVTPMAISLHRYSVGITHVDRGALKAAQRIAIKSRSQRVSRGRIYIDEGAMTMEGKVPADYGVYEHRRGGEHAFFDRTVKEAGPRAIRVGKRWVNKIVNNP